MTNLLAFAAEVVRKLARPQKPLHQEAILKIADEIEAIADRLVDIVFPERTHEPNKAHKSERT